MTGDSWLYVLGAVKVLGLWLTASLIVGGIFSASKVLNRRWRERLAAEHRRGFNAGLAFATRVIPPPSPYVGPLKFQAINDDLAAAFLIHDTKLPS